jgi:hypothetical protein
MTELCVHTGEHTQDILHNMCCTNICLARTFEHGKGMFYFMLPLPNLNLAVLKLCSGIVWALAYAAYKLLTSIFRGNSANISKSLHQAIYSKFYNTRALIEQFEQMSSATFGTQFMNSTSSWHISCSVGHKICLWQFLCSIFNDTFSEINYISSNEG